MTREESWNLLCQYVKSESLRKHCLAVEGAMIGLARKQGEDETTWGNTGLLHDIDYELYPEEHPAMGQDLLAQAGVDVLLREAILGHAMDAQEYRSTPLAKALFAADELASFIVACALVRPSRSFDDLELKSVKKKLKDKAFARGVDRELMTVAIKEWGVDPDSFMEDVLLALRLREKELQAMGTTML